MQLCFVIFQSLGIIDFSYVFGSYHVSVKGCGTSSFLDNGILKQLLKEKVPEKLRSRHFLFFCEITVRSWSFTYFILSSKLKLSWGVFGSLKKLIN